LLFVRAEVRLLLAFVTLAGTIVAAETARVPVLVELFTSEGCSSCPPADALLMQLDRLQPVAGARAIVLSEHVDYWDQLGWKDPYSSAEFSRRQSEYARLLGSEVYTPQIVIDGRDQYVGSSGHEIQAAIARAAQKGKAELRITDARRDGSDAVVSLAIPPLRKGKAEVWVAVADERDRSSVNRGENNGRTLDHVAVVRSLAKIAILSKSEGLEKTVRLHLGPSSSRVVVFLKDSAGLVLGAEAASIP
jgi:hypothetical protein